MRSYLQMLRDVVETGEAHADRTGVGTTSLFGYQLRHDMRTGFPLLTTKRVFLRGVVEELRWFLRGSGDARELQAADVRIWDEWATAEKCAEFGREEGDLGPVYGPMWRAFPVGHFRAGATSLWHRQGARRFPAEEAGAREYDQVAQALADLRHRPESRRILVSAWHPYWSRRTTLPPCHVLHQLKAHADGGLSLLVWLRSCDAFLGAPFDIATFGLLLLAYAKASDRTARHLVWQVGDLHVYDSHREAVVEQLSRVPGRLPIVRCLKAEGTALLDAQFEVEGYTPQPAIAAPVAV
jgi:thymidylate synthase